MEKYTFGDGGFGAAGDDGGKMFIALGAVAVLGVAAYLIFRKKPEDAKKDEAATSDAAAAAAAAALANESSEASAAAAQSSGGNTGILSTYGGQRMMDMMNPMEF